MKVLFVEPPKDFWFVMGEYLPPPLGIIELAAYLEIKNKGVDIKVLELKRRTYRYLASQGLLKALRDLF